MGRNQPQNPRVETPLFVSQLLFDDLIGTYSPFNHVLGATKNWYLRKPTEPNHSRQGSSRHGTAMNVHSIVTTARTIVTLGREKEISFLAGSIAYFAFISLIPAMVLVLAVGSLVGGERFAVALVQPVESALSEEGSEVLTAALENTAGLAGASIVGLVVLAWSALKVFRALDIAFDRIYAVETRSSITRQLLNGIIVALAIGTALALLVLVRTTLVWLEVPFAGVLGSVLLLGGLIMVLTPMYYVMPPVRVSFRHVLPGSFTAVVGLFALQQVFQIYASNASQYQAYGFIGAVLLFLLWLYFGATIILMGVVVNAALSTTRAETTSLNTHPHAEQLQSGVHVADSRDSDRVARTEEDDRVTDEEETTDPDPAKPVE